jgi:mono/diheme cytochrome c family protein
MGGSMQKILIAAAAAMLMAACSPQAPAPATPELTDPQLIERGQYMVRQVVLCGDCHTPQTATHEWDMTRELQGAPVQAPPPMANYAPQIAGGPANYTDEQFIHFVRTGERPDGTQPRPPMPPYRLNEEDARAVVAYIKSLPQAPAVP